jgi:hypothetical protein
MLPHLLYWFPKERTAVLHLLLQISETRISSAQELTQDNATKCITESFGNLPVRGTFIHAQESLSNFRCKINKFFYYLVFIKKKHLVTILKSNNVNATPTPEDFFLFPCARQLRLLSVLKVTVLCAGSWTNGLQRRNCFIKLAQITMTKVILF